MNDLEALKIVLPTLEDTVECLADLSEREEFSKSVDTIMRMIERVEKAQEDNKVWVATILDEMRKRGKYAEVVLSIHSVVEELTSLHEEGIIPIMPNEEEIQQGCVEGMHVFEDSIEVDHVIGAAIEKAVEVARVLADNRGEEELKEELSTNLSELEKKGKCEDCETPAFGYELSSKGLCDHCESLLEEEGEIND